MTPRELAFLQGHFQHYYRHHTPAPVDLTAREFGFGWDKKIDYRHAAFSSHKDLAEFLVRDAPLYASYSVAYYQFPSAKPVSEKGYLGADVVFDLDQTIQEHDHQPFFCRECLRRLHQDALNLKRLLESDLGFEPELVFSGQKGFHLHVRGDTVRNLSKEARRQLAEYVSGEGLRAEALFPKNQIDLDSRQSKAGSLQGPDDKSQGWAGRAHQAVKEAMEKNDAKQLKSFGLSRKNIQYIQENPAEALENLKTGHWNAFCDKPPLALLEQIKFVQTDKAVTFDLARLIRLPESLHGSTGFVAKRLQGEAATTFKVEDAAYFPSEPIVEIRPTEQLEFTLFKPYSLLPGRLEGVPLNVAIFLLAQGKAALP